MYKCINRRSGSLGCSLSYLTRAQTKLNIGVGVLVRACVRVVVLACVRARRSPGRAWRPSPPAHLTPQACCTTRRRLSSVVAVSLQRFPSVATLSIRCNVVLTTVRVCAASAECFCVDRYDARSLQHCPLQRCPLQRCPLQRPLPAMCCPLRGAGLRTLSVSVA